MEKRMQRTLSGDSLPPSPASHSLSSAVTSTRTSRKGRLVEPDTTSSNIQRAISVPPPPTKSRTISVPEPNGRPVRSSEPALPVGAISAGWTGESGGNAPANSNANHPPQYGPGISSTNSIPDAVVRTWRSALASSEMEPNRASFSSSIYSLGSTIMGSAWGSIPNNPSSVAGPEPEDGMQLCLRLC